MAVHPSPITRKGFHGSPQAARGRASGNVAGASAEHIVLIRDTLSAFNQANITNNYSVMYALASPSFRVSNKPERLSQLFAVYRVTKVDLAPILYLEPILAHPPVIEDRRLRLVGSFPPKPVEVTFDLTFERSGGVWRLFGIAVGLSQKQSDT